MKILNEINEEILGICEVSEIEHEIKEAAVVTDRVLNTKRKIEAARKTQNSGNVNVVPSPPTLERSSNTSENTGNSATSSDNIDATTDSENNVSASNSTSINTEVSNVNTNTSSSIGSAPISSIIPASTLPKLPKLQLPKFSGKVTEWSSFWDLYNTAIHSNDSMSKVNKFNYLFSLLEGNAARSIKGITHTSANYDAAIQILQERFGKTQQIIAAHMDQILQIPACSDGRTG